MLNSKHVSGAEVLGVCDDECCCVRGGALILELHDSRIRTSEGVWIPMGNVAMGES